MSTPHPEPVPSNSTHLQPDGTVFPPVTPDTPPPPGYRSPLDEFPDVDTGGSAAADASVSRRP
jgi:hypothetical protein